MATPREMFAERASHINRAWDLAQSSDPDLNEVKDALALADDLTAAIAAHPQTAAGFVARYFYPQGHTAGSVKAMAEAAHNSLSDQAMPRRTSANVSSTLDEGRRRGGADPEAMEGVELWSDQKGRRVPVLAPSASMAAMAEPEDFEARDSLSLGNIVRGRITGKWEGAEAEQKFMSSMGGGTDTAGGFLATPRLSGEIIDMARAQSVTIRAGARTVPMGESELHIAKITSDPTLSWVGEHGDISTTKPVFGRVKLRARKVAAIIPISLELLEDAPNAGAVVDQAVGGAFAAELDRVMLVGSGAGEEPRGILNHPDINTDSVGGAVDWDDLLDAQNSIWDNNGDPSAWIAHPTEVTALNKLKVASEANHYAQPPAEIADLSRFRTTQLTAGNIIMGGFSEVLLGMRTDLQIRLVFGGNVGSTAGISKGEWLLFIYARADVQVARANQIHALTGITA